MIRRSLLLALLLSGIAVLFLVQRHHAAAEVTPRPILYFVADTQREAERIPLALTRVSDEEEIEEGKRVALRYGLSLPRPQNDDDRAIIEYVNQVGTAVAAHVSRTKIPYHFYLQDYMVNAYALPGGHIVVGRGLLALLESEDELAAILGHEIAHVDERHAIEKLQYELASQKLGFGDLYQLGSPAVELFEAGYTKEQELEADRVGLDLAVAAGYSPTGGVNVMKRFQTLEEKYLGREPTPMEGLVSVPFNALAEYFRSHPAAADRRVTLETQIVDRHWNTSIPLRTFAIRNIFLADEGERLAQAGDFQNSTTRFQEAVKLAPGYLRGWRGLAETRWRAGDPAGTLAASQPPLHALPLRHDWMLAARALAALHDDQDAVGQFAALGHQAPVVRPEIPEIEIAGLNLVNGAGTIDTLKRALPQGLPASDEASARTEIAWWLYRAGKIEDAAEQVQLARELTPQSLEANLLFVWILTDMGKQADATQLTQNDYGSLGMPSWQQQAERVVARAVIQWRTENHAEAEIGFREAAHTDPAWMVPAWVQNNFSPSVDAVVKQLQAAEETRRAKESRDLRKPPTG